MIARAADILKKGTGTGPNCSKRWGLLRRGPEPVLCLKKGTGTGPNCSKRWGLLRRGPEPVPFLRKSARVLPAPARNGLSLLEVIVAMSIFLFALVAIGRLINLGTDLALDVEQQSRATQLCQSKLSEVVVGAVPLSSQSNTPFDEDPNWSWSLECEQASITGLWNVTVKATRQRSNGSKIECSLSQMVLDPSIRGTTFDAATSPNTSTNSSSASSNSSSSPSQTSPSTNTAPAAKTAPATKTGGNTTTPNTNSSPTKNTAVPKSGGGS
jgi:general secretion pathway protein I